MTDGKSSSSPRLPDLDLSQSEFDLTKTLESILANPILHNEDPEAETVQKRASNVFKLSQENEKLKAELRAMTERLEAAERKQQELAKRARFKERNDVAS
ncbi:hypothetical protein AcV7_009048 [Taiwanofungus camphoratus]|nr:hypothetical protein AcV7_009048 [Antrodia cinnamomea]